MPRGAASSAAISNSSAKCCRAGVAPADLARADLRVDRERAVLCEPGNVDEFVTAVVGLSKRDDVAKALGVNARHAVIDEFSWTHHVDRTLRFAMSTGAAPPAGQSPLSRVATGDAHKEQVQDQWNYNPVGTHYTTQSEAHTLDWFKEIETCYGTYAPWMLEADGVDACRHDVLEIGGGVWQRISVARHGARVPIWTGSAGQHWLRGEF